MNKTELVKKIAEKAGLSQAASKEALDAALDAIQGALKKGDSVQLIGFGTFSVQKRAARTGKNPATGEAIKIPAKKVAKWKASSSLL
jgi:DNA-binding protein HU-beta